MTEGSPEERLPGQPEAAPASEPAGADGGASPASPAGTGGEAAAGSDPAAVEQDLNALVEEARSKADEYLDLAQRTRADFDNYRKRMAAESAAAAGRGRLEVIGTVIDAVDNLERVLETAGIDPLEALEGEIPAGAPVTEQGVIVAWRDLHTVLHKADVEAYAPTGERFDPAWHEAMQAIPGGDADSGTVLEVLQRGYRSGDTVIRAARVVVAQ